MSRKPYTNKLVPTREVDRWLANQHVATPDERIVSMIQAAPGPLVDQRWTPELMRQTVRYALWRHHQNYLEYAWVMGSH